jgi:hypothetical protein
LSLGIRRVSASLAVALVLVGTVSLRAGGQTRTATGVVDGLVTDTSLVPLAGATASILGSSVQVVTGESGRFRIIGVPVGRYIVVIHRVGYGPEAVSVSVAGTDTLRESFMLARIVRALDTVVVVAARQIARMSEFEERRKAGFGHFLTRADIEQRGAIYVSDLLRPVLSVAIANDKRSMAQYAYSMRDGCYFQIVIDGILMRGPAGGNRIDLNALPPPASFAGIEIYSGPATIPLQYKRADSGCGVMLFWTKGRD